MRGILYPSGEVRITAPCDDAPNTRYCVARSTVIHREGISVADTAEVGLDLDQYKWGFSKPENYVFKARKGLSHEIVEEISEMKGEPDWMRQFRHKSLDTFLK